ncbi:MAG: hypothetical protein GF328_14815 [Candidatus Latescibacteria bacterium]|nr:hypothetical protein [Candidatus Latescibacterota bacterium]
MRRSAAGILVLLAALASAGAAAGATLHGRVFSAEHEDSLARGAPVLLLVERSGEIVERLESRTDEEGLFHFHDLDPDSALSYTVEVTYDGREFRGRPTRFAAGQDLMEMNLLLSAGLPDGEVPPDHPSIPETPRTGRPVEPNPLHTLLITAWIVLLFLWLVRLSRPSDPGRSARAGAPDRMPEAEALVRDIAALDNRREDGVIGEEEHRKVRAALKRRLEELTAGARRR